ncbi:helix-turn-helix domain-containing protein [Enterococcus sp. AZ050]|uniref:helix-turn-helix domain-containing protein n=1 Tax=Enterococcus sp. AZ050 TaxID=2774696 RepID=UPI003F20365C
MENRIAELRKEKGLTLKELGKALNIRDNTLSQYETGKRNPQLGLLQEIADYFDVSIEYLLMNTNRRDYKLKSDRDALRLLHHLDEGILNFYELSKSTSLNLAIWIAKNTKTLESPENKHLVSAANSFFATFLSENEVLKHYSTFRKKEQELFNDIEEKLMLEEDYHGATPKQVLDFIKESERISFKDIDKTLDYMKSLPDDDSD